MAVAAECGSGAGRSIADRPGPRLLAAIGAAIAATSLAAAFVLVIRRMQVSFDTSGIASIAAVIAGIVLVALVDAASTDVAPAVRTLQRLAVRLGLALTVVATLPGPSVLLAPHARPLWLMAITAAVGAAVIAMVAPLAPWRKRHRKPPDLRPDRPQQPSGDHRRFPAVGRRRRSADDVRRRPATEPSIPALPPSVDPTPSGAVAAVTAPSSLPPAGLLQQRFERYVLPDERADCLRGTLHLSVVAGSRLAIGHIGFCPPFHHLPQVEVGTACEEVEATITAAEVLPWGVRIECRLDEPADETILIPIEVVARASLPATDEAPLSPSR